GGRDGGRAGGQRVRLWLGSDRRPLLAPCVDAVGRFDRRAIARGGSHFRRDGGRCLIWCRKPSWGEGSRQDQRLSCCRPGTRCGMRTQLANSLRGGPDEGGRFGIYGGRFVAETLMPLILAVEAAYTPAREDPG